MLLTEEQLATQKATLEEGIAFADAWFQEAKDFDAYEAMSEKEKTLSRLIDPLMWLMREALVTFEHEDCDECRERRESDGNRMGITIAEMFLGRM